MGGVGLNTGTKFIMRKSDVTDVTATDITNVLTAWTAAGATNPLTAILSSQSTSWVWKAVTVTDLGTSGMQQQGSVAQSGTASGSALPPQCTVCLSWHAPLVHWRGGKPRNYLPGIPASAQISSSGSALVALYCSNLATQAISLQTKAEAIPASSGTWQLGFLSYETGHAPRATPSFFHYNSVNVHQRLDSQRRRSGKESTFGFS